MSCINSDTKDLIIEKLDKSNINSSDAQEIAEFLEKLPVCTVSGKQQSKKGKRPLSKYNLHMSSCLKTGTMIDCVKIWKKIKTDKNI